MSSEKDEREEKDEGKNNRREFFHGAASGMAGLAMAAMLSQMGVPIVNAAQADSKPSSSPETPFLKNSPPWPKGTDGHIYDHLFSKKLKENSLIPDVVPGPQAYFRGDSDLPGAKVNIGWQIFTKPYKLETQSHHHDCDEYLFFLGATFPDLVGSFDAEIEYFIGNEYERHIINKACVLYLPAGLEHNPCDIRRVGKPLFFSALELAPYFNGVYQSMGYMEFRTATKID
ncbi:MAG: hypothetical protein LBP68_04885 [Acidobacteriota bacterium]|jgi:hypothetical protein|nr:hypothetical protein [Acidobacteriota bacterium]